MRYLPILKHMAPELDYRSSNPTSPLSGGEGPRQTSALSVFVATPNSCHWVRMPSEVVLGTVLKPQAAVARLSGEHPRRLRPSG